MISFLYEIDSNRKYISGLKCWTSTSFSIQIINMTYLSGFIVKFVLLIQHSVRWVCHFVFPSRFGCQLIRIVRTFHNQLDRISSVRSSSVIYNLWTNELGRLYLTPCIRTRELSTIRFRFHWHAVDWRFGIDRSYALKGHPFSRHQKLRNRAQRRYTKEIERRYTWNTERGPVKL